MTEECKSPMVLVTNDSSQIIENEHLNPLSTPSEELSSVIKDESVLNGKYPPANHQYCTNTICSKGSCSRSFLLPLFLQSCFTFLLSCAHGPISSNLKKYGHNDNHSEDP